MKQRELEQERRKQSALEKLGSNKPRCIVCGESDWRCLERHHIAGRKYDELCAIVCRNCHRKLSDAQRDHPAPVANAEPSLPERIAHLLLGLADFLALLVDKLREFGHALIENIRATKDNSRSTQPHQGSMP